MNDRNVKILEILTNNKNVKVNLLAELLDVSQVTLRRDLDSLEKCGIIRRTHGYASLDGADETARRMAVCYSVKRRIAKAAVETVEEGETVLLESGSCCAFFAEELAQAQKNATIITNSMFISNYICKMLNIKVIVLSGFFQPESHVLVGPLALKSAENIFTDKFFIGTDGFIPAQGFTGRDHLRAETALGLTKRANNVFILTESAKFTRRGAYNLLPFNSITGVFTDDKIPKEAEGILIKNDIRLNKVPFADEQIKWRQFAGQTPILYNDRNNN